MTVYLAGPIMGCTDAEAKDWRREASDLLDGDVLDPMVRDYRGCEDAWVRSIVEQDKANIDTCDAVIAYCPKPSVGTSMEVLYAWESCVPVVAVVPPGTPVSPWLRYHTTAVVTTVASAVAELAG